MWWLDVLIILVIIAGGYAFVVMARDRTRQLSSHTDRTAEQMYDEFADPPSDEDHGGGTKRDSS